MGWKGPLWVTQSNPLPKQGHLQQVVEDLVQVGLEYLQRRRLHSLPGQPGPGLHHPQREEIPHIQTELPVLQFVNSVQFWAPQFKRCLLQSVIYTAGLCRIAAFSGKAAFGTPRQQRRV